MTSPENSQNPESPQSAEPPQSPESHPTPDFVQNPETSNDNNWQSAAVTADQSVRSAVDRVRPAGNRVGEWIVALLQRLRQWLAPLLERVQQSDRVRRLSDTVARSSPMEWLRSATATGKHQRRPSRLRAVQAGVALGALGVVGVLIGSVGTPTESPQIDDAAHAVAAPGQTPEQAQAESRSSGDAASAAKRAQSGMQVPANAEGIDVSNHNGSIDWSQVAGSGKKFAFVLASDGTDFSSSSFDEQYNGAKNEGMIAGAYHFGRPDESATAQADMLLQTIGGYQNDGHTLPPVLDLEVDPDSGGCYGQSVDGMHKWIEEFNGRVKSETGQDPIIYASQSFWQSCTGDSGAFSDNPLWLASYGVDNPSVPGGWGGYSFWQYTESGSVPGISGPVDLNRFQGSGDALKELAR